MISHLEIQELCTTLPTMRTAYKYRYNGKEQLSSFQGRYDYGFRMYDAGVARFLSVDPLTKKYPELTPYQFGSNRPIDGVDLDGKEWFNSTTVLTVGGGGSLGASYGFNVGLKIGKAYDVIGVTYFMSASTLTPMTQDLSQGSQNPTLVLGGEVGADVSINILFRPTFFKSQEIQSLGYPLTVDISAKSGIGAGVNVSSENFGIKAGYGLGASITTGSTDVIINSLSITNDENEEVSMKKSLVVENVKPTFSAKNVLQGYKGEITTKSGKLSVFSGIKHIKKSGTESLEPVSNQNWKSANYEMAERKYQK